MSRLGIRHRLFLVVVTTVAVAVAGLVTSFNVVLARTLDRDSRDLVRSRAEAQLAALHFDRGHLSAAEAPDDTSADAYLWVFRGTHPLERPRAAPAVDRAARSLAGRPARFLDVSSSDTRLYSTPVFVSGRNVVTVVAGVCRSPRSSRRGIPPSSHRSSSAASSFSSSALPPGGCSPRRFGPSSG